MIKSATQLKAKVRNVSKSDDKVAKSILRIFFMERFLERVSISKYKNNFILKGGMLVSALLGINVRATMDIDTTILSLPLTKNDIAGIILDICEIPIDDNVSFKIISIDKIIYGCFFNINKKLNVCNYFTQNYFLFFPFD